MQHFPDKWKRPLNWLAWCGILALGLFCAFTAISLIDFDPEPIATAQLQRPTHAEQVQSLTQAIARQVEHSTLAQKAEPSPIRQDLIAIQEDFATLQFMVALILSVLGAALVSVLIASLVTLIPIRAALPKPPPAPE